MPLYESSKHAVSSLGQQTPSVLVFALWQKMSSTPKHSEVQIALSVTEVDIVKLPSAYAAKHEVSNAFINIFCFN
jgi:hypothetical protein